MLARGDIVKVNDSPCEVMCRFTLPHGEPVVFIIDKRTLFGAFRYEDECEFVRRPEALIGASGLRIDRRK